jgi:prepilin-type N-terminal cleavage/methylation domain-containing protein
MRSNLIGFGMPDNNDGFTLIEILIATAIFSVGILAIFSMQYWSVRNNTTGNITTQAANLARAQIETLKSAADVTALTDGSHPDNPVDEDGNPGGIFTCEWFVTNPLGGSTTRQIEVRVSWTKQGGTRTAVLTTITRGNGT